MENPPIDFYSLFLYYFSVENDFKSIKRSAGRPLGTSNPATALTAAEIHRLLNVPKGKRRLFDRALIALCLCSGCRIGTAVKVSTRQIVSPDGVVKASYVVQAANDKSGRTIRYFITKQGQEIIQDYINSIDTNEDLPLFPSPKTGLAMTPSSGSRRISTLLKRASIYENSSHCLRKTFISNLYLGQHLQLVQISHIVGHHSVVQTQKYINGLTPSIQKAMADMRF